ncbi:MAG TPA: hypothetical protein VF316_23910, partial [Polyangiaceae bacterium]
RPVLRARPSLLLMLLLALGCASASPSSLGGSASPASASEDVSFVAVVRLPAPDTQKGKIFRGVLLEAGGTTWVASYERDGLWEAFEGRRVEVTGERYQPENQALIAPHIRVKTLTLEHSDTTAQITRFQAEVTLEGQFVEFVWPADSKLAGEKTVRFATTEGREFFLGTKRPDAPLGRPVSVRGRVFEPSPYAARPYGEYLWVYDVSPR